MNCIKTLPYCLCLVSSLLFPINVPAQRDSIPRMSPFYIFEGSWEEIGLQQGIFSGEKLLNNSLLWMSFFGVSGEETLAYYEKIKHLIPDNIIEQMQGTAKGLSQKYRFIPEESAWEMVLINNLGMAIYNKKNFERVSACTAFAFQSEDGTFLGHNTDNMAGTERDLLTIYFKPSNGDNTFLQTGAFAGAAGVAMARNEKGLATTYNVGRPNNNPQAGLPVIFMIREVMAKCDTFEEAMEYFTRIIDDGGTYDYAGVNLILVDFKDSSMAKIQIASGKIKVTYGQDLKEGVTYIAVTNHFDDDFIPSPPEYLEDSSYQRYNCLMELLFHFEKYNLNTCWEILKNTHEGGEATDDTICRSGEILATTITDVYTKDTIYYSLGPPCEYMQLYDGPIAMDLDNIDQPSITGKVTELLSGQSVAEVEVVLKGVSQAGISLKTFTANDGTFSFYHIPSGTYIIRAKKIFCSPTVVDVIFTEGEVEDVEVTIFLLNMSSEYNGFLYQDFAFWSFFLLI